MMKIAFISEQFINKSNFSWLSSGKKYFSDVDYLDLDESVKESIFKLYLKTYANISKKLFLTYVDMLAKYDRWVIVLDDKKIIGFSLYTTHPFGVKLGITGTDGSDKGKRAIKQLHIKAFNAQGVYGEVSPPLEKALSGSVPEVSSKEAQIILGENKKITKHHKDRKHYDRKIKNIGTSTKMMVGLPNKSKTE